MGGATVDLNSMLGEEASKDPTAALARSLQIFLDGQVAPSTQETLEARLKDPQILQARLDDPVQASERRLDRRAWSSARQNFSAVEGIRSAGVPPAR